ncbi:NOP58 ribonucleoprotein [Columba livia]|uniref:Nucleolar protein 58 n=1 Tax=Columba livia TaxID=8932 RepID=A0A2I0LQA1_COLLI|nr:NOP58 ribonucleoprotein [Columba livia]
MLVLFETAAGYAIFKVLNEKKLQEVDSLWKEFETPEKANKIVKLKHFEKFQDTTEALAASTALVEGKLSKNLKKILKKIVAKDAHEQLAVADAKLGGVIKDKLNLSCIHSPMVTELMRGIRSQIEGLITGLPSREMAAMCLGLAHSLSRYKLKFSPDKVDTMIIQAISLLDDLDKELNNYIMRCREWYGWHFPELGKIITDNLTYCKCVRKVGDRSNFASSDVSDILPEEIEADVKAAAEISMGTEVSEEDINNIIHLCDQVIEISEYRTQLYDYLKNRMMAIAPNLTIMVGELVGARLIAHAGSLLNLAKHPASTVQLLGAEKALFRALKTKRDTPKFGLIYHASLVGQSNPKNKGKISRMLAAKTALTIRYDALGEDTNAEMGAENRLKVETRLRLLEERGIRRISGTGKALAKADKYQNKSEVKIFDPSGDSTLPAVSKKRKIQEVEEQDAEVAVKAKKFKAEMKEEATVENDEPVKKKKKKKDKGKQGGEEEAGGEEPPSSPPVEVRRAAQRAVCREAASGLCYRIVTPGPRQLIRSLLDQRDEFKVKHLSRGLFLLLLNETPSKKKSNRELNVCDPEMLGGNKGEDFKLFGCGETTCLSASRRLLLPVDVLLTPATHSLSLTPTGIIPVSLPVRQLRSRFCMRKNSWVAFLPSVPHPAACFHDLFALAGTPQGPRVLVGFVTNVTRNEPLALGMIPVPLAALHEKQLSGEEPVRPIPVIQAVNKAARKLPFRYKMTMLKTVMASLQSVVHLVVDDTATR